MLGYETSAPMLSRQSCSEVAAARREMLTIVDIPGQSRGGRVFRCTWKSARSRWQSGDPAIDRYQVQ